MFQHMEISKKAEMRLKWMDYIDKGNSVAQASRHFDHPYTTTSNFGKVDTIDTN